MNGELDAVNQSHAQLKKRMEAHEKSHCSTVEMKENALSEKTSLIFRLETEVKELKEQMFQESESHAQEVDSCFNKRRRLKEQLEEARKAAAAAKAESNARREEIKAMKTSLSAALQGLEERDDTVKSLREKLNQAEAERAQTSDLLKEKVVSMNKIKVG